MSDDNYKPNTGYVIGYDKERLYSHIMDGDGIIYVSSVYQEKVGGKQMNDIKFAVVYRRADKVYKISFYGVEENPAEWRQSVEDFNASSVHFNRSAHIITDPIAISAMKSMQDEFKFLRRKYDTLARNIDQMDDYCFLKIENNVRATTL